MLHDEIQSLNLELNQVTARNEVLKVDNASLLQRWLDHMNEAASKMNSANIFYEDLQKKHGWKEGDDLSGKGKGIQNGEALDPFLSLQEGVSPGKNGHRLNPG